MDVKSFCFADYAQRIGFLGDADNNVQTLTALMRCQLFTVPFENIDVQAGKVVSIDPDDIVRKIVYQPRGGYCYEVNSLFAMALTAVGIDYYFVGARPMFYPSRRAKTHMVVVATIAGEAFLCDLGFGSFGIRAPLSLTRVNQTVQQDDDFFMLATDDNQHFVLQALVEGEWKNQYEFDLYPHELLDFGPANFFNSKSPDAVFVQKYLIVKHHPAGRKILFGHRLKTVEKGEVHEEDISAQNLSDVLRETFGLVM